MAWIDEVALPFVPDGQVFFSPILNKESSAADPGDVFVIDQGNTNFYKYNVGTQTWTALTPPTYTSSAPSRPHFNRTLAISPDGRKLACCSHGTYYTGGAFASYRIGGGRRHEIYDIASDTWTTCLPPDFQIGGYVVYTRAVVWEDDDTLWIWCTQAYASASLGPNDKRFYGKCAKYTPSTDSWTVYTTTFYILGRGQIDFHGYASPAAIKADGSVIYLGATGGTPPANAASDYRWCRYTVATDSYVHSDLAPTSDEFCYTYDKDKLWYMELGGTCQPGYVDVSDNSQNDDIFIENTDRDTGYGKYLGIADSLVKIIADARAAAPELMSEATGAPDVTTNPAMAIGEEGATLHGELGADVGIATDCYFEYGTTVAYGTTTARQSKRVGAAFLQEISGLSEDTTYHFRAVAQNAAGIAYGADRTFTTGGPPNYWYRLNIKGIDLAYEDLDGTKELHIVLKNLSPTTKSEGTYGATKVKVDYEPAA